MNRQLLVQLGIWFTGYGLLIFLPPGNKWWVGTTLLFALAQFWTTRSAFSALFNTLLFTLPFEQTIRGWWTTVVSANAVSHQPAYQIYFGYSLKLLISVPLVVYLCSRWKSLTWSSPPLWLLLFLGWSLVSSWLSPNPTTALFGVIRIWQAGLIFFTTLVYFQDRTADHTGFPAFCLSFLALISITGTVESLLQHSLHLPFEGWSTYTTDGFPLYRVHSIFSHPNYLANYITMLIPPVTMLMVTATNRYKQICVGLLLTLSFITLGGTLSRSVWFTAGVLIIAGTILYGRNRKRFLTWFAAGCLVTAAIGMHPVIRSRLVSVMDVWTSGNGTGRLELIRQTGWMVSAFPWMGVGPNRFTEVMIAHGMTPTEQGFIQPVHNVFLLFAAELGLPATALFVLFLFSILLPATTRLAHPGFRSGIWFSVVAWIINAQFHTLFGQEPSFDLLMICLGYLYAQNYPKPRLSHL